MCLGWASFCCKGRICKGPATFWWPGKNLQMADSLLLKEVSVDFVCTRRTCDTFPLPGELDSWEVNLYSRLNNWKIQRDKHRGIWSSRLIVFRTPTARLIYLPSDVHCWKFFKMAPLEEALSVTCIIRVGQGGRGNRSSCRYSFLLANNVEACCSAWRLVMPSSRSMSIPRY